jgi:hypothetical protein
MDADELGMEGGGRRAKRKEEERWKGENAPAETARESYVGESSESRGVDCEVVRAAAQKQKQEAEAASDR